MENQLGSSLIYNKSARHECNTSEKFIESGLIKYIQSKIAKNIGLLYKAKSYIDKHSLLSLYHSYIRSSYINYGNIARESSAMTNLKKIYSQEKHAIWIVYGNDRLTHTRELFDIK